MITILAVDPASTTGWAILTGSQLVVGEHRINTSAAEQSIAWLALQWIRRIIPAKCSLVVYEHAAMAAIRQPRTAAFHSHFQAAIEIAAIDEAIHTLAVNPLSLKKFATGNGHATKEQMIEAARTIGVDVKSDNIADAIHLARLGERYLRGEWIPPSDVRKQAKSLAKAAKKRQRRLFK